jgi:hypothetical protein
VVTVVVEPGARSRCVQVVLKPATGAPVISSPMPVGNNPKLTLAIRRGAMSENVQAWAEGFSDAACKTATVPPERSAPANAAFIEGTATVELRLRPVSQVDADNDGHASFSTGGDDCDDTSPAVHPGANEACDNKLDDDCNGSIDCSDSAACDRQACAVGAQCLSLACAEQDCGDNADNDGDQLADCADPDCMGQRCLNGWLCTADKMCTKPPSEVGACNDGFDNDADGLIDCADQDDCSASLCSTGNACRLNATCASGQCGGGTDRVCMKTAQCFAPLGLCNPSDGGCTFAVTVNSGCDDQNKCTQSDVCRSDGGCQGQPVVCDMPPSVCHAQSVMCNPTNGACEYPVVSGQACDDSNGCTDSDVCDQNALCAGTPKLCPAAGECQLALGCSGGQCGYSAKPLGTPCSSGSCQYDGGCGSLFPYTPSHFDQATVLQAGGTRPDLTISPSCGTTRLDTGKLDAGAISVTLCGQDIPTTVVRVGNYDALLLAVNQLTIADAGVLQFIGERPVIIAATGPVSVFGSILAGGEYTAPGPGGNTTCNPTTGRGRDGGNGTWSGGGGGGAFGDGGAAGGSAASAGAVGGAAGVPGGTVTLVPLRGGCPGGNGGEATSAAGAAGRGGAGGGALQISTAGVLVVNNGLIAAPGGGGSPADAGRHGGGAGGSGGAVLLEAMQINITSGFVTANGGGGAAGAGKSAGAGAGENGSLRWLTAALGGASVPNGGRGGFGSTWFVNPGMGQNGGADGGGGGGGGGVGRIRFNVTQSCFMGGLVSPAASSNQSGLNGCP